MAMAWMKDEVRFEFRETEIINVEHVRAGKEYKIRGVVLAGRFF